MENKKGPKLVGTDERPWLEKIEETAMQFSQVIESRFIGSVMRAESFLPGIIVGGEEQAEENRVKLLECFIDYTMGTTVAILAHYASDDEQFEENLVAIMRDKFVRIRNMKKEGKIQ